MTLIKTFQINLLKVSKNEIFEEAKKEWKIIDTEIRENKNGLCICQHKLKHITYLYNIINNNIIIVGNVCLKKFNMDKNEKIKDDIFKQFLKIKYYNFFNKYEKIEDINEYLLKIKEEFKQTIYDKFENIKKQLNNNNILKIINNLGDFYIKIYNLICNNNLKYLYDVRNNLQKNIDKLAYSTKDNIIPKMQKEVLELIDIFKNYIKKKEKTYEELLNIFEIQKNNIYQKYYYYFNVEDDVIKWYKWFENNIGECENMINIYKKTNDLLILEKKFETYILENKENKEEIKENIKKEFENYEKNNYIKNIIEYNNISNRIQNLYTTKNELYYNIKKKLKTYQTNDFKKYGKIGDLKHENIITKLKKQNYKCYICDDNILIENYKKYCCYQFSIDRINNNLPHDNNNILISCYYCNCRNFPDFNQHNKVCKSECHLEIKKNIIKKENISIEKIKQLLTD